MPTPPNPDRRSTAAHPAAGPQAGSSLVHLQPADGPPPADNTPTVITSRPRPAADAGTPALAPGLRLGHFEVIEAVGSGGMATVLKARDLELGRVVALKILPPETAADPEVVGRFKQEARAAARLDHDHVARVYFCGEDRGLHFIAFEFVEGETLRGRIDRLGTVPPADCVRYMLHVAAGLGHAADRGVVHRDVKPSNILITPDGRAKLVDMGLARQLDPGSVNGGVTQSGVTLGTFDYISPEQALDPRRADVRSDIYSLGCTVYHALTGRPPVPDGTAMKKLQAHQTEAPLDPRDLNPAVPDGLAAVLGTMMAKDPARRHQTPADLTRDLVALARPMGLAVDEPHDAPAPPAEVAAPPRPPAGLVAGVSAAVVVAAVFVGLSGNDPPAKPPWDTSPKSPLPSPKSQVENPPAVTARGDGPPPADGVRVVESAEEFVRLIRDGGSPKLRLKPGVKYDLTDQPPAVFQGTELAIDSPPGLDPADWPTLAVVGWPADGDGDPPGGAFAAKGAKRVRLAGLNLVVTHDADPAGEAPVKAVGFLFQNVGRVELERFALRPDDAARPSGVLVAVEADPDRPASELTLRHGFVAQGDTGIRLTGRVAADAAECVFAPLVAAFHARPHPSETRGGDGETGRGGEKTSGAVGSPSPSLPLSPSGVEGGLALRHCTFLMEQGAAAQADGGAGWAVSAGGCVFAAVGPPPDGMTMPGMGMAETRPAVLRADAARFTPVPGEPNGYYRADPLGDPAAVVLRQPPWRLKDPAAQLRKSAPWAAATLDVNRPELRRPGDAAILGARQGPGGRWLYTGGPDLPDPRPQPEFAVAPTERVWAPGVTGQAAHRVHATLLEAWAALQPNEDLVVRHTGEVRADAVPPVPQGRTVTVRAADGFKPVLLPPASTQREASLFAVDGHLILHGLELRIGPGGADSKPAAAVVAGGGSLTVRHCVVTLDGRDDDGAAAAVLADPAAEARAMTAGAAPAVRFENTLVRGRGRAVWAPAARGFSLAADNSVFALDGSFLVVDPPGKDAPVVGRPAVRLSRVTAVLDGHLLDLRAGKGTGDEVPVEVEADRSLFAPADPARAKPLVRIDGGDPTADLARYLTWQRGQPNGYANYDRAAAVLEVRPAADDGTPPRQLDADRWLAFAREGPAAGRVRFARPPDARQFPTAAAADFRFESSDLADVGAGIEK